MSSEIVIYIAAAILSFIAVLIQARATLAKRKMKKVAEPIVKVDVSECLL